MFTSLLTPPQQPALPQEAQPLPPQLTCSELEQCAPGLPGHGRSGTELELCRRGDPEVLFLFFLHVSL